MIAQKKSYLLSILLTFTLTSSLLAQEHDSLTTIPLKEKQGNIDKDIDYRHTIYVTPFANIALLWTISRENRPTLPRLNMSILAFSYEYRFHHNFNIQAELLFGLDGEGSIYIDINSNPIVGGGIGASFNHEFVDSSPWQYEVLVKFSYYYSWNNYYILSPYIGGGIRYTPKDSWFIIKLGVHINMSYRPKHYPVYSSFLPEGYSAPSSIALGAGIYWAVGIKF